MYSLFATMKLWGLNLRTWLTTYLQACADNGNAPPVVMDVFLPWQMDAKRLAQMRACHPQEVLNRLCLVDPHLMALNLAQLCRANGCHTCASQTMEG